MVLQFQGAQFMVRSEKKFICFSPNCISYRNVESLNGQLILRSQINVCNTFKKTCGF